MVEAGQPWQMRPWAKNIYSKTGYQYPSLPPLICPVVLLRIRICNLCPIEPAKSVDVFRGYSALAFLLLFGTLVLAVVAILFFLLQKLREDG
jgi:hypothetical protein